MAISKIHSYFRLTKPAIMLLILVTGSASLAIEGSLLTNPLKLILILAGLAFTGGSANAFNMYFERDIDAKMVRTKSRPLPQGAIKPKNALIFAFAIGLIGVSIFALFFNLVSALFALSTIVYYAIFYTLILKPRTIHSIVIGGAAGAMGPPIAWVAATGSLNLTPALLFLIIFLWSPPHFWALALYLKKDYELAKLPMLPNVKGEKSTTNEILIYSILLVASSLFLLIIGVGLIYFLVAIVLGFTILFKAFRLKSLQSSIFAQAYFRYSIIYLLGVFAALIVDTFVKIRF
jgi:protoheme IX farnesyltransferase